MFGLRPQLEPFHLAFYLCLESCRRVNRPEKIWFHYFHEPFGPYWNLIKPALTLAKVEPIEQVSELRYAHAYHRKYAYAHHADFIRLDVLEKHGGVYADMDTLFVNRVPDALFDQDFVLGREALSPDERTGEMHPSLCNAFIMARKGARFASIWREEMPGALDAERWSHHSCQLAERIAERHPELLHVEPERTFYKHMWTREGLRTLFEGLDRDVEGMVSIHMWAHLWWSRRRREHSRFHAGLIDERRLRRVDTTYNVLARPFLPAPGAIPRSAHRRAALLGAARRACHAAREAIARLRR